MFQKSPSPLVESYFQSLISLARFSSQFVVSLYLQKQVTRCSVSLRRRVQLRQLSPLLTRVFQVLTCHSSLYEKALLLS